MADESYWIERAQSAEAKLKTLHDSMEPLKLKARAIKESLCAKEHSDGTFSIDFDKLVERLGVGACLELRAIIDARYGISGEPGEKPRVRMKANAAAEAPAFAKPASAGEARSCDQL